ncbi:unnamed protein product, partial [Cladocopium goreaui]
PVLQSLPKRLEKKVLTVSSMDLKYGSKLTGAYQPIGMMYERPVYKKMKIRKYNKKDKESGNMFLYYCENGWWFAEALDLASEAFIAYSNSNSKMPPQHGFRLQSEKIDPTLSVRRTQARPPWTEPKSRNTVK